jgi:hypothetical protein
MSLRMESGMSDLGYPSWDPGISCPCVWNPGCPPSWELPGPILANVSKWPFYCPDAKMTDLGSSCHCPVLPEIHQNTPFRSPVPILAVYTLIHMGNCVYLTRKLAIITLKSPKMASKTPKMAISEAGLARPAAVPPNITCLLHLPQDLRSQISGLAQTGQSGSILDTK